MPTHAHPCRARPFVLAAFILMTTLRPHSTEEDTKATDPGPLSWETVELQTPGHRPQSHSSPTAVPT